MKKFIQIFLFFTLAALINVGQTTGLPAGVTRVDSVEGINEYQLQNGLQVLLFPDETKQTTTVNIVYHVGSRHESYGETGMAHLLEHLLFKGSPKHLNIPAELTVRGANPNGTTWWDRTNYYESFVANDSNLNWALDLESDRMVNSFIAKKDLESEFSVVRNEMESGENSPSNVLSEKVMAAAYDWHNYGKDTIGARSDVENVKIENLQAFYRKYYQPDNATLIVAGKFDEAQTLDLINKKFGVIPKPTRILHDTWTIEPVQDGERQVTVRRVGDIQLLTVGYHAPPATHPDYVPFRFAQFALTGRTDDRLYKLMVETKKVTSVSGDILQNKEPTFATFTAQLSKDGSIEEARDLMIKTIESFGEKPPTEEEIDRPKKSILKGIEIAKNDSESVAMALTGWVAAGDWRQYFLYPDRVKNVTASDIQRVAKKYLLSSNRTVGMFIPTDKPVRAEVPTVSDADLAAMAKQVDRSRVIVPGENFETTPENIFKRTKVSQIGGLKTAFLSKKNRGDVVNLRLRLRFGNEKSLMNRSLAGDFVGRMLSRGTGKMTREQVTDEMNRLKSQITVFGSATEVFANVSTTGANLAGAIKFVGEMFKDPAFFQTEFDQMKIEALSRLESQRSEPNWIASRAMSKTFDKYPQGHVSYPMSLDEEIAAVKRLTLDDLKAYFRDFYGASAGELSVVGDFDENEIAAVTKEVFGNWRSQQPVQRVARQFNDIAPVSVSFETPDKANAIFFARMNINMRDDDPDYAAFEIGNLILGGGFLNSRLATRIRQIEGLSYGVGSDFRTDSFDGDGVFFASAIYAPENAEKLENAFREELTRAIADGFTDAEVAAAKTGWLLNRQRSRGTDTQIANLLNNQMFTGRTFLWDAALDKKVEALTTKQVNDSIRKYIKLDKISIFKAGNFAKAKGQ